MEVTVTPLGTRPPVIDAAAFTISVSEAVPVASSLWTVPVCYLNLHTYHDDVKSALLTKLDD